jgi:enoyl-CoA hydratase/carnithine racemase
MAFFAADLNYVLFMQRFPEPRPLPEQIPYFWGGVLVNAGSWHLGSLLGIGVITLTLNRPQAFNSLSEAMLEALQLELDTIARDPGARLLVIKAAGKAFCAGHDLKEMRASPSTDYYETLFTQCGKMMMSLQTLPVPVIAQVQGIATAAGCQLVAMCDLAVASSDSRFAVSGVNLGLFCATPSVALSRNLGRKAAFEMLVTGAFISADEAKVKGLVNRHGLRRAGDSYRRAPSLFGQEPLWPARDPATGLAVLCPGHARCDQAHVDRQSSHPHQPHHLKLK